MGDAGPDESDLSFLRHLPLTRAATVYAKDRHADQRRAADGALFMLHPLEVASLLERSNYPDHVVAAAVLHDVLEDTSAERSDLEELFGPEVADLVALVSDDPSIEDEEQLRRTRSASACVAPGATAPWCTPPTRSPRSGSCEPR